MRGGNHGRLSLEQQADFRDYGGLVHLAMRGETDYPTRKVHQQNSGGVQEGEYLSDMSIKVFVEYLYEDRMSLYMRQRPKIRDYTEVSKCSVIIKM
jgi:hypothetical protein